MENLQSFVQQKKNQEDKEKNLLETIEKKKSEIQKLESLILSQKNKIDEHERTEESNIEINKRLKIEISEFQDITR